MRTFSTQAGVVSCMRKGERDILFCMPAYEESRGMNGGE